MTQLSMQSRILIEKAPVSAEVASLLWKCFDLLRGEVESSKYKGYFFKLLFFRYISDLKIDNRGVFEIPENADFYSVYEKRSSDNLVNIIDQALQSIEFANIELLKGILPNFRPSQDLSSQQHERNNFIVRRLIEYVSDEHFNFRLSELTDRNFPGNLFSYLIDLLAKGESFWGGEYYTPQDLLSLMVQVLQPKSGMSLYDPAVGTGGMLITGQQFVKVKEGESANLHLFGQDVSLDSLIMSKMNLFFHQIFDGSVLLGDTLRKPLHVDGAKLLQFDLVLSSPPFSMRIYDKSNWQLEGDVYSRFAFGIPGNIADFAFLQHIIASLNSHGKAVVIVPGRVLFVSGQDGEIRKNIIKDDLIEAVIGLGQGLLTNTAIPIYLLVMNKAKDQQRKGKILFVNALSEYEKRGSEGNVITEVQQRKIVDAFNRFEPIESFAAVADFDVLADNQFNLVPSRYIELFPINNFLGGQVKWEKLSNISEILQSSALVRSSDKESNIPFIRVSDLSSPKINIEELQRTSLSDGRERRQHTQGGDVLLAGVGSVRTLLVDESLSGLAIGNKVFILRLKPDFQHLARYLVEFLRSDKGYNLLSRYFIGVAMPQLRLSDLRNIEIPIPEDTAIQLLTDLNQVETELLSRIDKAKDLRTRLFNITDPDEVQKQLEELSTSAQVLSSSLIQADSLDYQVRNFYPFPLAYAYRTLSSIYDPVQKYPEQLRVAENVLVFLAVTGLTFAQNCDTLKNQTDITNSTLKKFFGGGISPGDWQSLAFFAGRSMRGQRRFAVSDSFASLWFKGAGTKESEFAKITKTLVELKNDFKHDRGPKTPNEFALASKELQDHLDNCYTQLSFFIKYPIRSVQSIDIDWQTNKAILETLVYEGDHPGLRQERVEHSRPLTKDLLYLELDKNVWAPLYPHVCAQYCQSCKTRETYFIDRWDGQGNKITLKSFERGHTHESDSGAKQVATDMERWIMNSLNS